MSNQLRNAILAANLSMEVLDGVAHPLCHEGESLPAERALFFSTTSDNQKTIDIHLLQGNSPIASGNKSLGTWQIRGIPDAQRGIPKLRVTFNVEAEGIVKVKVDLIDEKRSLEVRYQGDGIPRVQARK